MLFAMNRLAFMVLFTAFFIVVLGWMSLWSLIKGRTRFSALKLLVLIAMLYLVQVVVILISISDESVTAQHTKSVWYLVDMVTLSIAALSLSVLFGYYGGKLEPSLSQSFDKGTIRRWRWLRKIVILCFALRCIAFIYGTVAFTFEMLPTSEVATWIDLISYPALYYTLPELVPGVGLLFMLAPPPAHRREDSDPEILDADIRSGEYFGAAFEEKLLGVSDRLNSDTGSINSSSPSAVRLGTSKSANRVLFVGSESGTTGVLS